MPPAASARVPLHTRSVCFRGFRREDGLYEIEATLSDVLAVDCALPSGLRRAGDPMHEMSVRLVFDGEYDVVGAEAASERNPYGIDCAAAATPYRALVGMNLTRGFRKSVQQAFGGVKGCTHLTELLGQVPTVAIQMVSAAVGDRVDDDGKPFPIGRCQALDTGGEPVRRYFPRWFRGTRTGTDPA